MATDANSTPAPTQRRQRDPAGEVKALTAYRDLGTLIFELRQAIFMMEAVDRDVMTKTADNEMANLGFAVFALTDEQEGARTYCLHHLGDLARQLLDKFDDVEGMGRAA